MIKVGITGGIGSGKSLICRVFSSLDVPVYNADLAARILINTDAEIKQRFISMMGSEIYIEGVINKTRMSELIFNNLSLLKIVNQIIHPKVAANFKAWCANHASRPYVIEESALLFESNTYAAFDRIILVSAPDDIRIRRILSRKDMTMEKIKAIMKIQLPEQEKIVRSHQVIINDGITLVIPQVLKIHALFITEE